MLIDHGRSARAGRPAPCALTALFVLTIALASVSASTAFRSALGADPLKGSAGPEWLGSRAGLSDEVLPPWTPVEASGGQVAVWGRTYTFRGLPFPEAVITRDTEILASPIRLIAIADGEDLRWTGASCRTVETKPNVVELATR
jgi:hypothetical protein